MVRCATKGQGPKSSRVEVVGAGARTCLPGISVLLAYTLDLVGCTWCAPAPTDGERGFLDSVRPVSVIPSEASVSSETVSLGEVEEEDLGGIVGDPYMPGDGDEALGVFDETHMISTYRLLELMAEIPKSVSCWD